MNKSAPSRKNKRFPQEKELPSGGTQNGVSPSLYWSEHRNSWYCFVLSCSSETMMCLWSPLEGKLVPLVTFAH